MQFGLYIRLPGHVVNLRRSLYESKVQTINAEDKPDTCGLYGFFRFSTPRR